MILIEPLATNQTLAQGGAAITTDLTDDQLAQVQSMIDIAFASEAAARDSEINTGITAQNAQIQTLLSTAIAAMVAGIPPSTLIRSYLAGFITAWVSTTSFSVGAGMGDDSTSIVMMNLSSSLTKTTSAWTLGTNGGGLDTGAIAANTWYHIHAIVRTDTSNVDVLFSLSPTAPTLPATYTLFRRIGSIKTDASKHFIKYWQWGDLFLWDQVVDELSDVYLSATQTITLTVPTGLTDALGAIIAIFDSGGYDNDNSSTGSDASILYQSIDQGTSPSVSDGNQTIECTLQNQFALGDLKFAVNSSAQIRIRTDNNPSFYIDLWTRGWIDMRGRYI
jgi:hypothetical protein